MSKPVPQNTTNQSWKTENYRKSFLEDRKFPQITPGRPQINVGISQITIPRPQNTANHSLNTAKHCKSVLEDRKLPQIIPVRPQITANYRKSLQEDHNSMLEDRKSLSQDHRTPQITV